ncbi:MAG: hypothetical protein U0359_29230 [Byssovorax sp.]
MNRPLLAALFLGCTLAALPAVADVSDADRGTARALALEGQEALDKGDFKKAADRFSRADSIIHAPTLLLGQARAMVGLGKLVTAQEMYNRILREGLPPRPPPAFEKALKDAARELDALVPRIPSVVIQVTSAASPSVTLDGTLVPNAALGAKRPVDPGKHMLRATAPGMDAAELSLTVKEGKQESVTLELKPAGTAPPPGPTGSTPPPPSSSGSGGPPPPPPPAGRTPTLKIASYAAFAVGGAGVVAGAVTGGLALGKHGALADQCPGGVCPSNQSSALDSYHLLGTISTVGFIVGGVGVAGGVALFLAAPSAKPAERATIRPLLGPGFLGAEGAF